MWIHTYIINVQRCFLAFYCFYVSLAVTHIYINNHHHAIVHHLFLQPSQHYSPNRTAKAHRRRSWAGIPLPHAQQSTPEIANPSGLAIVRTGRKSIPKGRNRSTSNASETYLQKCYTKLDVAVSASMCAKCIYTQYVKVHPVQLHGAK